MEINRRPKTINDVFLDYTGRREGLIKALTTEIGSLFLQCDPAKEMMYLYAYPNETWELRKPIEYLPTTLPEPALGINFTRDQPVGHRHWLSNVAVHSESWLLSVAFFWGFSIPLTKDQREMLFVMINGLPALHEVVTLHMDESVAIMDKLKLQINRNAGESSR